MPASWIQIDEEALAAIAEVAAPFVDCPNDVIRRLLDLPRTGARLAPAPRATTPAAGRGSGEFLREADFELPILRALASHGGKASRPVVMEAIEADLGPRLSESDREPMKNGEERWRNRASFCRRRLLAAGRLRYGSRRGTWELSEEGAERLRRLEAEAGPDLQQEEEPRPQAGEGRQGDQPEREE